MATLDNIAEILPDYYSIEIHLTRHGVSIRVENPAGEIIPYDCFSCEADSNLISALKAAIEDSRND